MARDNGFGIFTMDTINNVNAMVDMAIAKTAAEEAVSASKASDTNKAKALALIRVSNSKKNLLLGMSNFMLSHMGMKTT